VSARADAAAIFALEGLRRREGVLALVSPETGTGIRALLAAEGLDAAELGAAGRLTLLDARETLAGIRGDGRDLSAALARRIGTAIFGLAAGAPAGIRAYGELVGIAWEQGEWEVALEVERAWNALDAPPGFSLLCGYALPGPLAQAAAGPLHAIACQHAHVIPAAKDEAWLAAIDRAVAEEPDLTLSRLLGASEPEPHGERHLPPGLRSARWLERNLGERGRVILRRADALLATA
jgi:hypothetical protein